MHKEEVFQWFKALIITAIIFVAFSLYLTLRRGYYNLYIINKVFGSTAAIVAAFTLIIGPLHRKFPALTHLMGIRRELGLVAFGLAIAHIAASLILQNKFAFPSWYFKEIIPVLFGVGAIAIWSYMTYISRNSQIKKLTADIWAKHLSLSAKIAFLAIFFHLVVMKYQGWLTWFKGQTKQTAELANPSYPPASLFIFAIMLAVIIYRLINDIIHRNSGKENQPLVQPQNPPQINQNPPSISPPA